MPSPPSRRRLAALLLLALLSLGLEVAHAAPASALPPALLTAATALGSHDTVRARFEQTKSSVLFVQDIGRLLWTYDDGPAFLMAGGRFYPAGKSAEEVGKDGAAGFSMPGAGDMSGVLQAVFTLDPEALAAHFSAKVTGPGVFELTPSGPAGRGMFSKVTLRVDGEPLAVRETAMDEPTGDRTVITFTDVAVDAPLPAERFMTPSERSAARTP